MIDVVRLPTSDLRPPTSDLRPMCGITGAVWNDPAAALDTATLERMTALVAHRGPDDRGCYRSDYRLYTGAVPQPGAAFGPPRPSTFAIPGRRPAASEAA